MKGYEKRLCRVNSLQTGWFVKFGGQLWRVDKFYEVETWPYFNLEISSMNTGLQAGPHVHIDIQVPGDLVVKVYARQAQLTA